MWGPVRTTLPHLQSEAVTGHFLPGEQALHASVRWGSHDIPQPSCDRGREGDRVLPRPPSLTESGAASPAWLRPPP